MVSLIKGAHPARTRYSKGVKPPSYNMLKPGTNNAKLGGYVTAKKWQGMAMYSLTLEERATCPTTCQQWENCYGNNMPFAHRFDHTSPGFYDGLELQLEKLMKKHAKDGGIVIRLHVLGDFFSEDYVNWWEMMLKIFGPGLKVFGYTHQPRTGTIGQMIETMNIAYPDHWQVRFSDDKSTIMAAHVVAKNAKAVKGVSVLCPEQTGAAKSCADCGLCWSASNREILFVEH